MFNFFKKKIHIDNNIDTLIGPETRVDGSIQYVGGMRVDGTVKGSLKEDVNHPSILIIGQSGVVTGQVIATKVLLGGKIAGPVIAHEFIELQSHSRIVGDLHYKSLEMHMGAVIEGRLIPITEHVEEVQKIEQKAEIQQPIKLSQPNLID